jgi:Uma2 family endonuclease
MVITLKNSPNINAERRVFFNNLTWQKYQDLLKIIGENRATKIIYDQGFLEIIMPSEEHENLVRMLELFIRILVVEMILKIKTMGSTTLSYPNLNRGAQPDNCFYIQNQSKVAGKKVNLSIDPPPDLVVEIDMIHTDIDKLKLYASMKIAEFWRYNGEIIKFYQLNKQEYMEVENSPTFPKIEKINLYQFLDLSKIDEVEAEFFLRQYIRQNILKLT